MLSPPTLVTMPTTHKVTAKYMLNELVNEHLDITFSLQSAFIVSYHWIL